MVTALLPVVALAGPSIVSDPTKRTDITHCAWYMDAAPRQLVAAPKNAAGQPYCKLYIATIAAGAHSVTAAFVIIDPLWGEREGPKSDPFTFSRPAAPSKPSGLTVVP